MDDLSRRTVLRAAGALGVGGALAGCTADGGDGETGETEDGATVAVGPGGSLAFDPQSVTIDVGDTVTWEFESGGHNVSAVPGDGNGEVSIPDDAEPFASYGVDGDPLDLDEQGTTYDHTFETPGEYRYVCVPHIGAGMIGTVTVEE